MKGVEKREGKNVEKERLCVKEKEKDKQLGQSMRKRRRKRNNSNWMNNMPHHKNRPPRILSIRNCVFVWRR
jgi:hypothetical protein